MPLFSLVAIELCACTFCSVFVPAYTPKSKQNDDPQAVAERWIHYAKGPPHLCTATPPGACGKRMDGSRSCGFTRRKHFLQMQPPPSVAPGPGE
uniref:Putative secreted protein n=1 Tax=Anopheles marajoara TaxID=58244 RepID=A0A2M4C9F9_9DIPT